MLEACTRPDLVAEITMQPVRRYGVDAAIFFSDIVLPLKATAGCVPRESYGRVIVAPPVGGLAAYGYQCAAIDGATRFTCTITDGTVYNFTVSIGRSSILDVRTVAP